MRFLFAIFVFALSTVAVACSRTGDTGGASAAETAPAAGLDRIAVRPGQAGDAYYIAAADAVARRAEGRQVGQAKNLILFIGDGMGVSTITGARIYAGQKRGLDGESYRLAMETLPNVALSKTYSDDAQVSDSASTATAMVTGVKSRSRTVGLTREASFNNCASQQGHGTDSLWELAERAGLATGIVSTARVTHATPAATFAESASRDWEDDTAFRGVPSEGCPDIASQFIDWPEGDGFEIAMGGGRRHFLPDTMPDPEDEGASGRRGDGRDLTQAWQAKSNTHVVLYDADGFAALDFTSDVRVLGLFEQSHLEYEIDRMSDSAGEPSLAELTEAAIERLSQDEDGYVLMVEGGRIDHAHHGTNAARALEDTDAFDAAVRKALDMTSRDDTLIIVTADHSHTMTIAGYPARGNPILGKVSYPTGATAMGTDGKPYTTLGYANGPGAPCARRSDPSEPCERPDLSDIDTAASDYRQQALVPMPSETHAGEDVAIFASGPGSNLINGVMEQNEIFHVMGRATGLVK